MRSQVSPGPHLLDDPVLNHFPGVDQITRSQSVLPYSIRAFRPSDREQLIALWSAAFPDDPSRNAPDRLIDAKILVQPDLLLVADRDGRVIGATMVGYDGFRAWIYHLAVAEDQRRKGIGTALLREAEDRLRALGCPKLNLQVRSTNAAVIDFYRRAGYVVEDRISMGRVLE